MDAEAWEHVTPAIDVLVTRADGWTAGITVADLDLPRGLVVRLRWTSHDVVALAAD